MCEHWWLRCTNQWGWGSRHHWVSMYTVWLLNSKWLWVQQWICIKFCVRLEHSSTETIHMIQKAAAMGNWWLAASSQQHTHLCITSYAEIFGKASNHPGDVTYLQPRFSTLQLLAFPKTKITFEMEKISHCRWDSGKYDRAAHGNWENCVRSQGAYFEGDWGIIVLCAMFLVSCIFFNKCLCFSYCMAGYLLDWPCVYIHIYVYECVCIPSSSIDLIILCILIPNLQVQLGYNID